MFTGDCPTCGKKFAIETKLMEFTTIRLNDKLTLPIVLAEKYIKLKEECPYCAKQISFKMNREGVLVEFSNTENPDLKEGIFGSLLPPSKELHEQIENYVSLFMDNVEKFVEVPTSKVKTFFKKLFSKRAA